MIGGMVPSIILKRNKKGKIEKGKKCFSFFKKDFQKIFKKVFFFVLF